MSEEMFMGRKNVAKKYLFSAVLGLNLIITVLSLILGCLMYTSNAKAIRKNLVFVEVTGLLTNIRYGLHFGKNIETYYGMQDLLEKTAKSAEETDNFYIVDDAGTILFQTGNRVPRARILDLAEDSYLKEGEKFYCSFPVSDGARMITESDISNDVKDWNRYYLDQTLVTTIGFLVVTIVMLILRGLLKETSVSYRLIMSLLVLWVLGISSLIGYCTYTEYRKSIEQMCETMERTVLADLERVHENGIDDENITGMDDYLKRYVENISEIDGVSLRDTGDGCVFHLSRVFLGRVKVDYTMQAFLLLAFSVMILTEYHLFVSGIHLNEEEDDYG